ncbi:hypothetical protein FWG86_01685 [Candidatus Saccharibacteria bacterium]|nr:hypothetical protein [Candidatus Saccharibacteria bacterium]
MLKANRKLLAAIAAAAVVVGGLAYVAVPQIWQRLGWGENSAVETPGTQNNLCSECPDTQLGGNDGGADNGQNGADAGGSGAGDAGSGGTERQAPEARGPATGPSRSNAAIPTQTAPTEAQVDRLTTFVRNAISQKNMRNLGGWQKVRAVHDFIIDHVDYDWTCFNSEWRTNPPECNRNGNSSFSAQAAAFNRVAVCQGYALLAEAFFDELGLANRKITSETHMWNVVLVNGRYLHVDITWDDLGGTEKSYDYFLVDDPRTVNTTTADHNFNVSVMNSLNAGRAAFDEAWRRGILTQILGAEGVIGMFSTPTSAEALEVLNLKLARKGKPAMTICPAKPGGHEAHMRASGTGILGSAVLDWLVEQNLAIYNCVFWEINAKDWAAWFV